MNVTRNVVSDLLPAYFSGEASADTRALVDEYFENDPEFAREARSAGDELLGFEQMSGISADARVEQTALKRSKRLLRIQALLLAVASTFAFNAITLQFSFEIRNGHITPRWLALPGQLGIVTVLGVLAIVFSFLYLRVRRRVRTRVL